MKRTFLSLMLMFLFISSSYAQEDVLRPKGRPDGEGYSYIKKSKTPIDIGFKFGLNIHQYSSDISWNPELIRPTGLVFEEGSGISPYFAFVVDWHLNKKMGIQFELGYEPVYFTNDYTGLTLAWDEEFFEYVLTDEYNEYEISGDIIDIGLFFRYNITNNLMFIGGPVIKIPTGDFTQDMYKYPIDDRFFYYIDDVEYSELRGSFNAPVNTFFAFDFGLAYKFQLSKQWSIVPQVSYQFALSKIQDNVSIEDFTQDLEFPSILTQENAKLNAFRIVATLFYSL